MELLNTISTSRTWTLHGTKIAYAFAIVLLVLSLASVAWHANGQSKLKKQNYAAQKIAPIKTKPKESYRVVDIVRANLFGDPSPAKVVQKNAPKTTLDLTLQGVLSATDENMARAIIMSGKRNSKLYSIGETIQGAGVSIEEIRASEVLLNRSGAIESLPLVKGKGSSAGDNSIITYSTGSTGRAQNTELASNARASTGISRSTPRPRSANGERRKIKKPNFSGLDRALQKMGEI